MSATRSVDDLVRSMAVVRDEDIAALSSTPAAEALLREIVAEPRGLGRRLPWTYQRRVLAVAVTAAVVLAVGVVLGAERLAAPAAAGIEIQRHGGYLIARVVDLNAKPEEFRAVFREHGLSIDLGLVPASPTFVGEIVAISEDRPGITSLPDREGRCPQELRCGPIGLRIPADWTGHAEITLGRAARPSETYVTAGSAFAPGEVLHCVSGVVGATVAHARAELLRRGIQPVWHADVDVDGQVYGRILESPESILGWVVVDAIPRAARSVHVFAEPSVPRGSSLETLRSRASNGC